MAQHLRTATKYLFVAVY